MAKRGEQKKLNATLSKAELTKREKEAEKRSEQRRKNTRAGNAGLSSRRLNRMEAEAERKSAEKRNRKPMTDEQKRMIRRIADKQNQAAQDRGDAKIRTEKRGAGSSTRGVQKPAPKGVLASITDVTKDAVSRVGRGAKALTGVGAALTPSAIGVGKGESRSMAEERATATAEANANRLRTQMDASKARDKRKAQDKISEASKPKGRMSSKEPTSIAEAKRMGKDYFIGKDGKRKAAVTAEELKASGMSLREYLNKQQGKTRMAKGGMVKANCGASMPPAQKSSKGNK